MRPIGKAVGRIGISANTITVLGVLIQAVAAWRIVEGALVQAALLGLASAIADVLDGAVAKARGTAGRFGALLDSTTDRLSDALFFIPIAWLYAVDPDVARHHEEWVAAASMATLTASFLVSYVKARAEGLGYECNVGIAERAERVILILLGLAFDLVPVAIVVLGIASVITFVQRLLHVRSQVERA